MSCALCCPGADEQLSINFFYTHPVSSTHLHKSSKNTLLTVCLNVTNLQRLRLLCYRGGHDIVHIEDAAGNRFATRITNVFVIGKGNKPLISLPKGKGVRLTILQEQSKRYASA